MKLDLTDSAVGYDACDRTKENPRIIINLYFALIIVYSQQLKA